MVEVVSRALHLTPEIILFVVLAISVSEVSYNVLSSLDYIYVMFVICGRSMWRSSFRQVIVV